MNDALKHKARELGLAAVGIAPAIEEVQQAFVWARSVVCAAISYLPPESKPPSGVPCSLVARVARGADYHTVLREKLTQLAQAISTEHPRARVEVCVDTCPLPERKLAVLAGIAWRGKNGNVFVDGDGSWVALGEIVTDIQADVQPPQSIDRCGDCRRCIDACPTKAIIAPYEIDCDRCLSALTQVSGSIPVEMRAAMGNRIYGCDVCQEVCPQNESISPVTPEFARDIFPGAAPELLPLISLSAKEFKETVAASSIGWIRRTRIRRNTAIAAANLRSEAAMPALLEMLEDENPVLREVAKWAVKEIAGSPSK